MNTKYKEIIREYKANYPRYVALGDIVSSCIKNALDEAKIDVLATQQRIKEEKSLERKLELKGEKYANLSDITDVLGARIICYFSDDVDRAASLIENMFDIDWENSVDKRSQLNPDAFGYLALHYICSLPECSDYPEELKGIRFEIQIRSTLQHTWASIYHDLGYKSEFGVPKKIMREFSRVAGLLEIADDQFIYIRNSLNKYGDEISSKIAKNEAQGVLIDLVSLTEYVFRNSDIQGFIHEIAALNNAKVSKLSPENYLEPLKWLGKRTIGDLQKMLRDNHDLALKLADSYFDDTDLEVVSTNAGLRLLCHAELLNKEYSLDEITKFMNLTAHNEVRAQRQAERLVNVNFSM